MSGDVRGTSVRVIGYTESAYKNPGADGNVMHITQNTITPSRERVQSATLSGFRGQSRSVGGNVDVGGAIAFEIAPEDIGFILKHLVGAPTTVGAGPYTHTFQPATTGANALPPGITLEVDYSAAMTGTARYLQTHGVRFGDGTFTINPTGFITLSVNGMGATWEQAAAPIDATPTDNGHKGFDAAGVSAFFGPEGAPFNICLSTLALTYNNDLDPDKRCISGGGVRDGLAEGFAIVGGSGTAFFDHEDVVNTLLSAVDTELTVIIKRGTGAGTVGNEQLKIHFGDIVFAQTAPGIEGQRGLRVQFTFTAHRDGGAEIDTTFELKNAVATIN